MLVPPVMAQLIRAIGGPTGPYEGPVGPRGVPGNLLLDGAPGATGSTGIIGLTGHAGLHGLDSTLIGPTGQRGPTGSIGPQGPLGMTGSSQFAFGAYFENRAGIPSIPYRGVYAGSNFLYTTKRSGILVVAFSGLVKSDGISISVSGGGVAGGYGFGAGTFVTAPNLFQIPFFVMSTNSTDNPIPLGETLTFDLSAYYSSTPFDFGPHGSVINIACAVLEF